MTERLGFPAVGIAAACAELYSEYGTTLSGLVVRPFNSVLSGHAATQ
jgi:hypothetical protein